VLLLKRLSPHDSNQENITMALSLKKSAAEPVARPSARQRIDQLTAERRQVIEKIIALETQGVRALPAIGADIHALAVSLAAGEPAAAAPVVDDGAELIRLYERRSVIDRALDLLHQQEIVDQGERVRELMEREKPQWMAAIRKRAMLALALLKANCEVEVFARRFSSVTPLPGARFRLLGTGGEPHNEAIACAEELVRLQILTKKEAELP
jgi:hypothetical protein